LPNLLLIPIGFAAGIFAGYLGIGGGPIFVPILFFALANRCPEEVLPKISVATSNGAIIFTGIGSAVRHWQLGHVEIEYFLRLALGALIGAFFGGYIISVLPSQMLTSLIAVVLFLAAVRVATAKERSFKNLSDRNFWWLTPAGILIGAISSTVGIGGGILSVPILAGVVGLRTRNAAGTSSAITFVLSLGSLIGHIYWGKDFTELSRGFVGFVNIPYALMLGVPAAVGAVLGAGLHKRFEPKFFKWIFAAVSAVVAGKIAFFD
jgi:uncharacterized membrane protein YfcA